MVKDVLKFNEIKLEANIKNFNISEISDKDIAIIGIGLKLPMADNMNEFWENICCRIDCIAEMGRQRKADIENYLNFLGKEKKLLKLGEAAFLDDVDRFDYSFFKISPKEASLMDPSQRLFLETAWSTIEDAGYTAEKLAGSKTGIYLGYGSDNEYKKIINDVDPSLLPLSVTGNLRPVIAGRLSYLLDLHGPSLLIDSTCSSSLVAVHLACQAIQNGECEMALAGGIQIHLIPIRASYIGTESTDGRTKTFSDMADGTGTGEGIGVIMLKPLSQAIKNNDCIYAVIKGSAVNSDGNSIGLTAPNPAAQENVIVSAWEDANVEPETISYIEAHGTGTKLGDPIEIDGIRKAFSKFTSKAGICAVSSVKSNLGHLDCSAGITGLIKAVMALKNRKIPPTINYSRPNRNINFIDSPVYVNDRLREWGHFKGSRRCGVSSFGISGTNCHIVLEEAPDTTNQWNESANKQYVFTLSAKSRESLVGLIGKYIDHLERNFEDDLRDICFTSNTCRGHYNNRLAVVASDKGTLIRMLRKIYDSNLTLIEQLVAYYGEHSIITNEAEKFQKTEYTENEIKEFNSKCVQYINELLNGGNDSENLLDNILKLYIKGAGIDWDSLYTDEYRKKVRLPTYAFDSKRCWVEIPEYYCGKDEAEDINNMFYETKWKEYTDASENSTKFNNGEEFVIFYNGSKQKGQEISSKLVSDGCKVYIVESGTGFENIDVNKFCMEATFDNYRRLFEFSGIQTISHLIYLTDGQEECSQPVTGLMQNGMEKLLSLFYLLKALVNSNLKSKIKLTLITQYAFDVLGTEKTTIPLNASLAGIFLSARLEYPQYQFKIIDIVSDTEAEEILMELGRDKSPFKIALRQNKFYFEELYNLNINEVKTGNGVEIKDNGTYVITGGLGSMGLDFANHLADSGNLNIVLIGRTDIPDRNKWDELLERRQDESLCIKISSIKRLEEKGSTIHYYPADVSCMKSMETVFEDIVERFGKINGVIHCAGIGARLEGRTIGEENEETFRQVVLPKVLGTIILGQLVSAYEDIDFLILFSSPITLIGGVGSSHYTAANCFLDAYAARNSMNGKHTVSVGWAPWHKKELLENGHFDERKQIFKPIMPDRGLKAFSLLLAFKIYRVIVGELNFTGSIFQLGDLLPFALSGEIKGKLENEMSNSHKVFQTRKIKKYSQQPSLVGKRDNDYSQIEKSIAFAWAEVLGYEEMSIFDSFFELGGDSISIVKVFKILEKQFPGKINVVDLFAYPTISGIAKFLSCQIGDKSSLRETPSFNYSKEDIVNRIEGILDSVKNGEITIEQAEVFLLDHVG